MPLESKVLDSGGEKVEVVLNRWKSEYELRKKGSTEDMLLWLAYMYMLSKEIESGKKPHLEKTELDLFWSAKEQFRPEMLSQTTRHLYFKIKQTLNEAYSVAERYVYKK